MIDNILLGLCAHVFGLWLVDYCHCHHFGVETALAVFDAVLIIYFNNKDKKK